MTKIPQFVRAMSDKELHGQIRKFFALTMHGRCKPCSTSPGESPYWALLEAEADRRRFNSRRKKSL
jgi:hypothetical protein